MQKTRDHPNSRSGYVKEDVLKAISGFFIILAFIAVISLFAGMGGSSGGSSGGTSNSGSSDSKVIFVVNDMLLEAPKDTTWEEFVSNESLNTPRFTIVDDNVYLGDSKVIDSETNLPVTPDMPIDSNIEYKDESYIGGSGSGSDDSTGTEEESEIPTNLTGYTVTVPSGWSCPANDYAFYNLSGSLNSNTFGYSEGGTFAIANDFEVGYGLDNTIAMIPDYFVPLSFSPASSLVFIITGGNDVANLDLIQWLVDNKATFEKTQ